MHYRPEIDGLRALAVTAVILFHAHLLLPGGFVGVDVFFVISGYLIASLLARDLDRGTFRISTFWERRVRRIFPASVLVVLCTLLVGGALCMPERYVLLARSAIAHALMSANIYFCQTLGYFDGRGETAPLLHMWSLAVEEQFYLVFPLLLAWLWPLGRRRVLIVLACVALVSLGMSVGGASVARTASFFLLPARAWEMLLGAILAVRQPQGDEGAGPGVGRSLIGWAGLGGIFTACLWYSAATPYPGWQALVPCVGTVMFLWSQERGPVGSGRLLARQPVRLAGQMSFSLYLWHWPIMAFIREVGGNEGRRAMVAAIFVTAGLSILSWCFVEEPFRRGFRGQRTSRIIAAGAGMSLTIIAVSAAIIALGGWPGRLPPLTNRYAVAEVDPQRKSPLIPEDFRTDDDLPRIGAARADGTARTIVLWGDSHAGVVCPVLHRLAVDRGLSIPAAVMSGVTPIPGAWKPDRDARLPKLVDNVFAAIEKLRPSEVVWVGRWSAHFSGLVDGGSGTSVDVARRGIARTIARLRAAGVEQIWIGLEVPCQSLTPPQVALRQWHLNADPLSYGVSRRSYTEQQQLVWEVFAALQGEPGVQFLDLAEPCFTSDGIASVESEDGPLYLDQDHLSDLGAERFLRPMLEATIFGDDPTPGSSR